MTPHRIAVKFFAAPDPAAAIDLHPFVGIFHRFIQKAALPGLLLDVADYAHVPEGPGVVLIGHDVDYAIDLGAGQTGLLTTRKRLDGAPLAESLRDTLRRALAALAAVEAEAEAKLRFATGAFRLDVLDRLAAPNRAEGFAAVQQAATPVLAALYGAGAFRVERVSAVDPRRPLALQVSAQGAAPGAAALAARLGA
jgi:hypothetical protein